MSQGHGPLQPPTLRLGQEQPSAPQQTAEMGATGPTALPALSLQVFPRLTLLSNPIFLSPPSLFWGMSGLATHRKLLSS